MKQTISQIILKYFTAILITIIALWAFIDGISGAMSILTFKSTTIITLIVLVVWLGLELYFKNNEVYWSSRNGVKIRITKLSNLPRILILSFIVSIWFSVFLANEINKSVTFMKIVAETLSPESTYENQILELDKIKNNLHELESFIDIQKNELKGLENVVSNLKIEKEELKPLVDADKKLVEGLISETIKIQDQEFKKQREKDKWVERTIGFFIGILSSLIASFIYQLIRREYLTKKNRNMENVEKEEKQAST